MDLKNTEFLPEFHAENLLLRDALPQDDADAAAAAGGDGRAGHLLQVSYEGRGYTSLYNSRVFIS